MNSAPNYQVLFQFIHFCDHENIEDFLVTNLGVLDPIKMIKKVKKQLAHLCNNDDEIAKLYFEAVDEFLKFLDARDHLEELEPPTKKQIKKLKEQNRAFISASVWVTMLEIENKELVKEAVLVFQLLYDASLSFIYANAKKKA